MKKIKQKFPIGTFVWIAKDLGKSMQHFPKNRPAQVIGTYYQLHGYSEKDKKDYQLLVRNDNGTWSLNAWYHEHQLVEIFESNSIQRYKKEINE